MHKVKIIVIDDNLTARNTLKSYLANDDNYEVVADFSSAKDALRWLRENEINVVLCDMQMPVINGIEFMQLLRATKSDIPVIAISSFDDFDYLRGSMINGAADYLLKHELNAKSLVSALDKVKQNYNISTSSVAVKRLGYIIDDISQFTTEFIDGLVADGTINFAAYNILPIAVSPNYGICNGLSYTQYKEYQNEIMGAVVDIISQLLGSDYPYIFYKNPNKELIVLISFKDQTSYLYIKNIIIGIVNRLTRRMVRMLDTSITAATGTLTNSLATAIDQCTALEKLVRDSFYISDNRIFQLETAVPLEYKDYKIGSQTLLSLEYELSQGNLPAVKKILKDILAHIESARPTKENIYQVSEKILYQMVEVKVIKSHEPSRLIKLINRCDNFSQFKALINDWLDTTVMPPQKNKPPKYSPAVQSSIDYINENYQSEISLNSCAQQTGISYTHLSREFKRETGQGFVAYLNQVRLSRAKSLLVGQNQSIKEVVALTGFSSYNYFFNVFKKYEGTTPAEFVAKNYS